MSPHNSKGMNEQSEGATQCKGLKVLPATNNTTKHNTLPTQQDEALAGPVLQVSPALKPSRTQWRVVCETP